MLDICGYWRVGLVIGYDDRFRQIRVRYLAYGNVMEETYFNYDSYRIAPFHTFSRLSRNSVSASEREIVVAPLKLKNPYVVSLPEEVSLAL